MIRADQALPTRPVNLSATKVSVTTVKRQRKGKLEFTHSSTHHTTMAPSSDGVLQERWWCPDRSFCYNVNVLPVLYKTGGQF